MDKSNVEKIADRVIYEIVREVRNDRRIREFTAITPVSQTAKNCLFQAGKAPIK